ncbi:hypothetical protein LPJ56_000973 [Coemansia sp. RSA 2599]|nr:hypothetical protein LPJ75_000570 [Coemansia sp. RSA 2598]KAJ1828648.1 hypothetical protein LPJ56_000973 [Coemansia sp. RSA 2599]
MSTGDIEEQPWKKVHEEALRSNERSYIDPATGYTAFTELSHLDRGYCCGNKCRHCPYDYENVGHPDRIKEQAREARKKAQQKRSRDKETARRQSEASEASDKEASE